MNPHLRFCVFDPEPQFFTSVLSQAGMGDIRSLISSWRNSLRGVQTGLRQIHVTIWSSLKEEARATFNLLLLRYKLDYLHPHSFSKDNPHQKRPTSLCNGIIFIVSTHVNSTSALDTQPMFLHAARSCLSLEIVPLWIVWKTIHASWV